MIRWFRFVLLFLALMLLALVSFRWGGWLTVREIKILPTRYVSVEKLTEGLLGDNILRVDLEPLRREILEDPRVLGLVTRINFFLCQVEIEVRERSPVVKVKLGTGESVWVDEEGVVLEPAEDAVVVAQARGNRVSKEVVEAALAWERLPRALRERYSLLDLSGNEAFAMGHPQIRFGMICQVPAKLGILIKLWREGLLEGYALVNLRGDDFVILRRSGSGR